MLAAGSRVVPGYHLKSDAIAGRYRVETVLGGGAAGFVVIAQHVHTRERVRLKVLTQRGARATVAVAATLTSPHVARIVDSGVTDEGYPFIATELLEGKTLAGSTFSARRAVELVVQACRGLTEAHAKGLVHGDLKPQNLLLTPAGELKILDFGMAMPLSDGADEASAAWFASPAYLAPEQLRDPTCDAKADIWALGVILHQLVSGRLPFDAETIAGMFVAVAYDEPAMLAEADVPYELAKVVQRCLAKPPSERPTALELASLLAPFAASAADAAEASPRPYFPDSVSPMSIDGDDVIATRTIPGLGPVSRMTAALKKSASRPPPLPSSRLGSRPRPPRLPSRVPARSDVAVHVVSVAENVSRYAKGWIATQVAAYRAAERETQTAQEQSFARRRWGALGVIGAAAALGVVALFAPAASTASPTLTEETVLGAQTIDEPADLAVLPFVPASFALPEREKARNAVQPAPEATPTAVLPRALRITPRPRPRLAVREDPYAPPGFTHPSKLRDPRKR